MANLTWHEKHESSLSFGDRLSDLVANGMGPGGLLLFKLYLY